MWYRGFGVVWSGMGGIDVGCAWWESGGAGWNVDGFVLANIYQESRI